MSQNKTRIQGLTPHNDSSDLSGSTRVASSSINDIYQRTSSPTTNAGKTVVAGMYENKNNEPVGQAPQPQAPRPRTVALQERPIVGLLYSRSHLSTGEIFPVYLGRNVIGSDFDCDICLREETVSRRHAVIVVRQIANPQPREIASITDTNSSCGVFVNGELIDFDTCVIENNDLLQIGSAYQLVFIKLSAKDLNLSVCPFFGELPDHRPTQSPNPRTHTTMYPAPEVPSVNQQQGYSRPQPQQQQQFDEGFNPYAPDTSDNRSNKTVISTKF